VIGGDSNETLNQVYDPATDTWTTEKPMPVEPQFLGPNALSTLVSAEVDGKIYMMTYYTLMPSGTWVYSPARDSWASLSSSPFTLLSGGSWWSHAAGATTGVNAAKRIYVFFESYPYSSAPPYLAFDPLTSRWTKIGELTVKRRCFGVAVVDDVLYVIGGRSHPAWSH